MQAAELDAHSARIQSNIALLLLVQGQMKEARALMDERQFAPAIRAAIRDDAKKVAAAARTYRIGGASPRDSSTTVTIPGRLTSE
jgi:Flp pilus assembly protein TadD